MHPTATIEVDGQPVSGAFWERLIRLTVTDHAGKEADTVDMDLLDGDPFLEVPKRGSKVKVWLGYDKQERYMGEFVVDDISIDCLPYQMTISGRSADVRKKLKQQKSRSFENKTVKEIAEKIAADHGLEAVVSDKVGAAKYEWQGQADESDLHFLERLARRHSALLSFKDGKLIMAERGAGKSASGKDMTVLTIPRNAIVVSSCKVRFGDRGRYKKVKALYQDNGKQKRIEVEVESDPDSDADYTIQEPFGSEDEAKNAAKSKSDDLKSSADTTECKLVGDPDFKAGTPFQYAGVRPVVDDITWTAETVTHDFTPSGGYTVSISGKRKPDDSEAVKDKKKDRTGSGKTGGAATQSQRQSEPPAQPTIPWKLN